MRVERRTEDAIRAGGLLWLSSPLVLPVAVDGAPARLPETRPGQPRRLVTDLREGELFTIGGAPVGCDGHHHLREVGGEPGALGVVGPTGEIWNPPADATYYVDDDVHVPHTVWLSSADTQPVWPNAAPQRFTLTRPGESVGVTFDVGADERYAVSVIDRGLIDPERDEARFEVGGFGPPGSRGLYDIGVRGSSLASITTAGGGVWTIYVDPAGSAVGPLDLDIERIEDAARGGAEADPR